MFTFLLIVHISHIQCTCDAKRHLANLSLSPDRFRIPDGIWERGDEQIRRFYHFFQAIKKELFPVQNKNNSWKEDFKKISVWKDDDFGEIEKGFKNWQITEF
jgi:hypothetical protein